MTQLNPTNIKRFMQLLEEESTIKQEIIPTIHALLLEATEYKEQSFEDKKERKSKKAYEMARLKMRTNKQNNNMFF